MLSWFASDFFAKSPALAYPVIALGIFMTIFVTTTLRALLEKKDEVDRLARLPLEADDE
jgi:hypothetical protein